MSSPVGAVQSERSTIEHVHVPWIGSYTIHTYLHNNIITAGYRVYMIDTSRCTVGCDPSVLCLKTRYPSRSASATCCPQPGIPLVWSLGRSRPLPVVASCSPDGLAALLPVRGGIISARTAFFVYLIFFRRIYSRPLKRFSACFSEALFPAVCVKGYTYHSLRLLTSW